MTIRACAHRKAYQLHSLHPHAAPDIPGSRHDAERGFEIDSARPPQNEADILLARITAAARTMTVPTLRITAAVVGVLAEVREPEVALRSKEQGRKAEHRPPDAAPT